MENKFVVNHTADNLYDLDQIEKIYTIDSEAYGGLLCTKKSDESMALFTSVRDEDGNKKYIKIN